MPAGRRRCYGPRFRPLGDDVENASSQQRARAHTRTRTWARIERDSSCITRSGSSGRGSSGGAKPAGAVACVGRAQQEQEQEQQQRLQEIQKWKLVGAAAAAAVCFVVQAAPTCGWC